jgi:hypothetical protein
VLEAYEILEFDDSAGIRRQRGSLRRASLRKKLIRDGLAFDHGDATISLNKLRIVPFIRKLTSL